MKKTSRYLIFTILIIFSLSSFSSAIAKRKVNFIKNSNQSHLCKVLNKADKNYILAQNTLKKYFRYEDFKAYSCSSCNGKTYLSFNPKDMLSLSKQKKPYTIYYANIKNMKVDEISAVYVNKKKSDILKPEGKNLEKFKEKSKNILKNQSKKSPTYIKSFIPLDIKKTYSTGKNTPLLSVSSVFSHEGKYFVIKLSQDGLFLEMVKEIYDKKTLDKYIKENIYKNL